MLQNFFTPFIISSSVGDLTENDLLQALETKSTIYLFNKKVNFSFNQLIEKMAIKCYSFDVIYHLIDDIMKRIEKSPEKKIIKKKTGEVLILKIFYIKNVGYVAGFKVTSGIIKNYSQVKIIRNQEIIHEGVINSLQKEREAVRELSKGHEGALSINKYEDWKEGDIVEVYTETKVDEDKE